MKPGRPSAAVRAKPQVHSHSRPRERRLGPARRQDTRAKAADGRAISTETKRETTAAAMRSRARLMPVGHSFVWWESQR